VEGVNPLPVLFLILMFSPPPPLLPPPGSPSVFLVTFPSPPPPHLVVVPSCHITQRNRLAWPHRRRGLASDGVRYAGARSSFGRRFRSATKLRLEWYGRVLLLLQQRSKRPQKMVITLKASTSLYVSSRAPLWLLFRPDS